MNKFTCCICGKEFEGFGNNPDPIKMEGRCCDNCNYTVVLTARLKQVQDYIKMLEAEAK